MNATSNCPFPTAWTPQQIAGATTPRVLEIDAVLAAIRGSAGTVRPRQRVLHAGYLPRPEMAARFRMHG